jgi:hypothetical protein
MWEYRPQRPLVFTHIPKTAGTSLREAVKAGIQPKAEFTGFGAVMLGPSPDVESLPSRVRRQVAYTPDELPPDAEFVSGHIAPSTTRARFPEGDHFTVLREPRVRLVSNWLFARAHTDFNIRRWGSIARLIRAARANLREYANNPLVGIHADNGITRLLLWPHRLTPSDDFIDPVHDDELFEQAVEMLDTFSYVGVVENQDLVDEISRWLGHSLTLPRLNEVNELRQPDHPDLDAEVSGEAGELLRWRSRIDTRLWRHVATRTFPADTLDELSERELESAIARYKSLVAQPPRLSYPRRIVEGSYNIVARLKWGS